MATLQKTQCSHATRHKECGKTLTDNINELPGILACECGNSKIRIAAVQGKEITDAQTHRLGDLGDLGKAIADIWTKIPSPKYIVAGSVNPIALNALEAAAQTTSDSAFE